MIDISLKILVVGVANSDDEIRHRLENKFKSHSANILFFDNGNIPTDGIFDPNYPSDIHVNGEPQSQDCSIFNSRIFNTDSSQQLATVLIQEHERRDKSSALLFHDNLHANHMLWNAIQNYLIEHEINSIVFLHQPKSLTETILYQIAKALDLKTLVLVQSVFPNRYFSCQALSDYGEFNVKQKSGCFYISEKLADNALDSHSQFNSEYQDSTLQNIGKILLFLLKVRSLRIFDPMYIIRRAKQLHDAPNDITDWKDPFAYFFYTSKSAYFEFLTDTFETSSILNQKFVYFPLQSTKDLYSEDLFNRYSDQILAVEQLARIIPDDIKIIVKNENQGNPDYLTPMWFHRIRRISSVIHVPSCVDSNLLLENCEILSTVSSNQGWKAMTMGKRALVFGRPWYWKLSGAYLYRNNISFDEIVRPEFQASDLKSEISALISISHEGDLNQFNQHESKHDCLESNPEKVAIAITGLLLGELDTTFQASSPS